MSVRQRSATENSTSHHRVLVENRHLVPWVDGGGRRLETAGGGQGGCS